MEDIYQDLSRVSRQIRADPRDFLTTSVIPCVIHVPSADIVFPSVNFVICRDGS